MHAGKAVHVRDCIETLYVCMCVCTLTHIKRMCVSTYMRVYIDYAICPRVQHSHLLGFANPGRARFPY